MLYYNGGKSTYTIEKQLAPGEQIWANVGDIIHNQIPDRNGKTIPANVMMGSYELRDLDHIGVGYLYEGKLVIDKGWGHGYYGCAGCCGDESPQLKPNPNAGAVSTTAPNTLELYDVCTASWVDDTGEAYDWASTNTGIVTLANAYSSFISPGSATGSASIQYQLQWARMNCPVTTYEPQNQQNSFSVQITAANIARDVITVVLSGPAGASGQLVVTWSGAGPNPAIANAPEGPGSYTFNPSLTGLQPGQYTGVSAQWTVGGATVTATYDYNFNVLGVWRHSQYNTPTESQCSGSSSSAYEVNATTCAYQTNNLISQFSQSWENGSGKTINSYYGYSSEQNAQYCINTGHLPSDATGKSFAFEPAIIPYCGSGYSLANNTVAWNFSSSTLGCGDQVLLVGYGSSPVTVKTVTDRCGSGCTNQQLDNYTTSAACDPDAFSDLGNFTTIRINR